MGAAARGAPAGCSAIDPRRHTGEKTVNDELQTAAIACLTQAFKQPLAAPLPHVVQAAVDIVLASNRGGNRGEKANAD
jgi:hypothetical protein